MQHNPPVQELNGQTLFLFQEQKKYFQLNTFKLDSFLPSIFIFNCFSN
jgi:hypothetical protein